MPHLEDLSGHLGRLISELTERPVYIGRDPSICDICFPDDIVAVSRIHASLRWDDQLKKCVLRDEGSMNGTYISGQGKPIVEGEDIVIDLGQEFYVAQSKLRLRVVG